MEQEKKATSKFNIEKDLSKIDFLKATFFLVNLILLLFPFVNFKTLAIDSNGLGFFFNYAFLYGIVYLVLNIIGFAATFVKDIQSMLKYLFIVAPFINIIVVFTSYGSLQVANAQDISRGWGMWMIIIFNLIVLVIKWYPQIQKIVKKFQKADTTSKTE